MATLSMIVCPSCGMPIREERIGHAAGYWSGEAVDPTATVRWDPTRGDERSLVEVIALAESTDGLLYGEITVQLTRVLTAEEAATLGARLRDRVAGLGKHHAAFTAAHDLGTQQPGQEHQLPSGPTGLVAWDCMREVPDAIGQITVSWRVIDQASASRWQERARRYAAASESVHLVEIAHVG